MPERVRLTIDGQAAEARTDESLLAALWNAGRLAVRTSVGGEPRGPLCGMGTCHECRVTVDGTPHRRSCLETVREGMDVITSSRGARPGAGDEGALGPRPGTGLGMTGAIHAEVVIVGGGPAGVAAAVHAAESGASTLLLDEQARLGGQVWRGEPPVAARPWLDRLARSGARVLGGAAVVDAPAPGELLATNGERAWRVGYERLVLATGARELFLPFPGWTLPGVLGAGGAQALLKAGARFSGRRVVVAGSGPLLVAVAANLRAAGASVAGIAEQASLRRLAGFAASLWRHPGKLAEAAGYAGRLMGVPYRAGAWVREARGRERVERVLATDGRHEWEWECDVLACGFGLVPSGELARLLGCETAGDGAVVVDPSQRTSLPRVFAAGETTGVAGVEHALTSGACAGLSAAGREAPADLLDRRRQERDFGGRLARAFAPRREVLLLARPDTVACRCEDVTLGRLDGLGSMREAKLHTRVGMGPCQGRVCGPALAATRGFEAGSVRPPLAPVPIGALSEESAPTPGAGGAPSRATRSA